MATLRTFFSAAARIHLICSSRSASEPCEQFRRQPLAPAMMAASTSSGVFVAGPIVAKIFVRLKSLLIYNIY